MTRTRESTLMRPTRMLLRCVLPTALLLLASVARAQVPGQVLEKVPLAAPGHQQENPADEAPAEGSPDTPVDLAGEPPDASTPDPGNKRLRSAGPPAKPS